MAKGVIIQRVVATVGACLLVAGAFLPLWVKNGIAVTGWEGDYLSVGRWVLVLAALLAVGAWALPPLRKSRWMWIAGLLGLLQAGLILWQGYKLDAIGWGSWVLLGGAFLVLVAGKWRIDN